MREERGVDGGGSDGEVVVVVVAATSWICCWCDLRIDFGQEEAKKKKKRTLGLWGFVFDL